MELSINRANHADLAQQRVTSKRGPVNKQGHIHDSISRVRLGRGGNVVGRGGGGCRIHDSISSMQLGRSGDARTARKTPKMLKKQMVTDGRTDGRT